MNEMTTLPGAFDRMANNEGLVRMFTRCTLKIKAQLDKTIGQPRNPLHITVHEIDEIKLFFDGLINHFKSGASQPAAQSTEQAAGQPQPHQRAETLTIAKERFRVEDDSVIVLRGLDRDEIKKYVDMTAELRAARYDGSDYENEPLEDSRSPPVSGHVDQASAGHLQTKPRVSMVPNGPR
ncbi:hypothetical protein NEUTE1DRAFT_115490 [Neurospora tetrasperma FGSC 2508]|uniref:DUF8035 domain-containing protein n=1 Tax=Neurospora tetrasperma (strain FGSC 2508 / ATCC MYA-4615 / P0657) TaxID=510951 RepID=F8MZL9_NEUT8|nr:uncharacterized protein NEUTE1DRAFT_115490 [Neurospora tetrasperma FGSC 2508]EGO53709.1 hypothetical protein NEUTE1DRAFT_115490 [Neurospora tetrasperma FGSC 2508]EGZ76215.1 hypothetical protein NEUTE2DRAFT_51588 [Neurospora tetrasperma FGSC 2509]